MNLTSGGKNNITTIERDENMVKLAGENIKKYGLSDKINIVQGDCLDILENLEEEYDMIFYGCRKRAYNHFHPHCFKDF